MKPEPERVDDLIAAIADEPSQGKKRWIVAKYSAETMRALYEPVLRASFAMDGEAPVVMLPITLDREEAWKVGDALKRVGIGSGYGDVGHLAAKAINAVLASRKETK